MIDSSTARRIRTAGRAAFWASVNVFLFGALLMSLLGAGETALALFTAILVTAALLAGVVYLAGLKLGQANIRDETVDALIQGDRRVILFLRSFDVAQAGLLQRTLEAAKLIAAIAVNDMTILGAGRYDVEEEIDNAIGSHAALVAIGNKRVSYGAAKAIVSDADWQDTFRRLTERACLIVMMPGPSQAVLWELSQIARSPSLLDKTVFVMPRRGAMPLLSRGFKSVDRGAEADVWAETSKRAAADLGVMLPPYKEAGCYFRLGADGRPGQTALLEPFTGQLQNWLARNSGSPALAADELWRMA